MAVPLRIYFETVKAICFNELGRDSAIGYYDQRSQTNENFFRYLSLAYSIKIPFISVAEMLAIWHLINDLPLEMTSHKSNCGRACSNPTLSTDSFLEWKVRLNIPTSVVRSTYLSHFANVKVHG